MFRWIRIVFVVLTFAVTWAYAALPGHHRALTPEFFGLFLIENGIYTDAPERYAEFEALLDTAQARAQGFFVGAKAPRIIICTSQECADRFDLKLRGLTLGRHLVFLGPKGLNEMILTHEFAHIHLHSRMGVQDVFHQRIPAWFNEGLATHLSRDPRVQSFAPRQATWIKQAQSFREWGRLHQTRDWQETYGAAKTLVAALHAEIGDVGLRTIIDDAIETGDFEAALRRQVGRDWP